MYNRSAKQLPTIKTVGMVIHTIQGYPFGKNNHPTLGEKNPNLCIKSFHLVSLLPFLGVNREFYFILRRFHAILFKDMLI